VKTSTRPYALAVVKLTAYVRKTMSITTLIVISIIIVNVVASVWILASIRSDSWRSENDD
jgi:type IV secretory pathway VirB3-like protein